ARAGDGAARPAQAPAQVLLRHPGRRASTDLRAVLHRAVGGDGIVPALPREPAARALRSRRHSRAPAAARPTQQGGVGAVTMRALLRPASEPGPAWPSLPSTRRAL